jgi:hypothetical protein
LDDKPCEKFALRRRPIPPNKSIQRKTHKPRELSNISRVTGVASIVRELPNDRVWSVVPEGDPRGEMPKVREFLKVVHRQPVRDVNLINPSVIG